eukprot:COSAG05_NODE_1923_length_3830_cov_4.180113_5_plen_67_part_00
MVDCTRAQVVMSKRELSEVMLEFSTSANGNIISASDFAKRNPPPLFSSSMHAVNTSLLDSGTRGSR